MDYEYNNLSGDEQSQSYIELTVYPKNITKVFRKDLILDEVPLDELIFHQKRKVRYDIDIQECELNDYFYSGSMVNKQLLNLFELREYQRLRWFYNEPEQSVMDKFEMNDLIRIH